MRRPFVIVLENAFLWEVLGLKDRSAFHGTPATEIAKANAASHRWAAEAQGQILHAAEPWLRFSDDELWRLMFGNTITRSWMVWSDGYCPACKKDVPMYDWVAETLDCPCVSCHRRQETHEIHAQPLRAAHNPRALPGT